MLDPPQGVDEVRLGRAGAAVRAVRTDREVRRGRPAVALAARDDPTRGPGDGSTANDASVVLLVESGGVRLLLTGDVEPHAQSVLAGQLPGLDVDVLKMPHHGSPHQDEDWLLSLDPDGRPGSVGADNDYGHPGRVGARPAGRRRSRRGPDRRRAGPRGRGAGRRPAVVPAGLGCPRPVAGWRIMACGRSESTLGRVTLVTGKEEFLNERTVREVRAAVRAYDAEAEVSETAAGDLTLATLGEMAAPSLFSSIRCVVVRNLEDLPEASVDGLLDYAAAPAEDVALVLVHGGGSAAAACSPSCASSRR